jgi:BA14K-like protein
MPSQPDRGKPLVFYGALLLVAASSVAFGLDWTAAPLPPMAETAASIEAAKRAAHLPQPAVRVAKAEETLSPPAAVAVSAPAPVNPAPANGGTPVIMAPEKSAQAPRCDVAACAAAYHSFRASDCSWQPYEGPRRLCDKGQPPQTAATAAAAATPGSIAAAEIAAANAANAASKLGKPIVIGGASPANPTNLKCNVEACKQAYVSFNPLDCTYQPLEGPRKFCDKGLPPQAATPAPATAAATPAPAAGTAPANNPPKCNVEACKQAYFTFNPVDCTFQPTEGPRTLCTK